MNPKKKMGYTFLIIAAFLSIYGGYLINKSSEEKGEKDKNEIIDNDDKNTKKLSKEITENRKEINALRIALENINKVSFDLEEETGFTQEQLKVIAKNVIEKSKSLIDKGNAFFVLSQYDSAIDMYSEVIDLDEFNSLAYCYRAKASFSKLHNIKISFVKRSTFFHSNNSNKKNYQTGKYLQKLEKILNDYNKAIELDPKNPYYYYERTVTFAFLKKYENALSDIENAINLTPNDVYLYNLRGIMYSDLGLSTKNENYYNMAIKDFDIAITLNPDNALFHYNKALVLHGRKDYDNSIIYNTKTIKLDSNFVKAYFIRGMSHFSIQEFEKAIIDFTNFIDKYDGSPSLKIDLDKAYSYRGQCYFLIKNNTLAIKDFDQVIKTNKKDTVAYSRRGDAYLMLKKHEKAISDYTNAISLGSNDLDNYIRRGICYASINDYSSSIKDFTTVINSNNNFSNVYSNRAKSYFHIRKYKKAIADCDKALKINLQDKLADQIKRESVAMLKKTQ